MIERDKEYYNQKISELYAVIENQEKIIRDLQQEKKQLQQRFNNLVEEYKDKAEYTHNLIERIDKAIEYIEHYKPVALEDKILEILKGENNG
jgi:predicted transcriptional regulator